MNGSSGRLGIVVLSLVGLTTWGMVVACSSTDEPPRAATPDAGVTGERSDDGGTSANACANASKPTHTCTAAKCTADNGGKAATCVAGKCVPLATDECTGVYGAVDSDEAIVIGSLLSTRGSDAVNGVAREESVALAVKEINAAGGLYTADGCGRRQLVYVACDDSNAPKPDDAGTYDRLKAAHHLVDDLAVVGIVGGMNSNNTIAAATVTFGAKTMLLPPSASSDVLTHLDGGAPEGQPLIWRLTAPDVYQTKAMAAVGVEVASIVAKPASTKVAILYRDDAFGNGGFQNIKALLTVNGKPYTDPANASFVVDRKLPITGAIPQQTFDDVLALEPDIIYLFAQPETSAFVSKYEDAVTAAAKTKPQYIVTKSSQRADFLTVVKTRLDIKKRFRGTSDFIVTPLMQDFFNFRFKAAYTDAKALLAGMPNSYDGAYLLAYAAQATKPTYDPVDPFAVVKAMGNLVGGTQKIDVGPTSLKTGLELLRSGKKIDFNGTSSAFDYDLTTGDMPGDFGTWCIRTDPNTSDLVYENTTGQIWKYADNKLTGTFTCPD